MPQIKTHGAGRLCILGAGAAGLSAGYYASKAARPFTIYESSEHVGGMCATFRRNGFSFDCGAHRVHDRIPEVTDEIKSLLGNQLNQIYVPSHIYHKGELVNFPFTPLNITKRIGAVATARAGFEVLSAKNRNIGQASDFETYAIATYGKTLAQMFLLNYSEKLWGAPCNRLSAELAGDRLKGLTPKSLILELLTGRNNGSSHIDGSFYYPEGGIGAITDALAATCGPDNIMTGAAVTGIEHDTRRITSIIINNDLRIPADKVVSTLPCTVLVKIMNPAPPDHILQSAGRIHFRNIILAALFLNRDRITKSATIYFPSPEFVFTRIYEPKNRSDRMSPHGNTSLVAEIPCSGHDDLWNMPDHQISDIVFQQIKSCGWVRGGDLMDTAIIRVPHAYPVIEKNSKSYSDSIQSYFGGFSNLMLSGRSGMFRYLWLHDMIRHGKHMAGF